MYLAPVHMQMASGSACGVVRRVLSLYYLCLGLFLEILPRDPWELASMLVQLVEGNCLEAPIDQSLDLERWTADPDPVQSVCIC